MDKKIKKLKDQIGVGTSVADELLILSGGDVEMAARASRESPGLDQCKARILDQRFRNIESRL